MSLAPVLQVFFMIVNEPHLFRPVQNPAEEEAACNTTRAHRCKMSQLEKVHNSLLNDTPSEYMFDQRAVVALDSPTSLPSVCLRAC